MFNLSYIDLETYIILSSVIFTLAICFSARNYNRLVDKNEKLKDDIKLNRKLYEVSIELARVDERFKCTNEMFLREAEDFREQCKKYDKEVKEVK